MTDWRVPLCIDGAEIQELRDIAKRATDELLLARKVVRAAREVDNAWYKDKRESGPALFILHETLQAYDEGEK